MANHFVADRWLLDTVAAGFVSTEQAYVKYIRWTGTGLTAGTSAVQITDAANEVLWSSVALAAQVNEHAIIERWWRSGFKLPAIGGGLVTIALGNAPPGGA